MYRSVLALVWGNMLILGLVGLVGLVGCLERPSSQDLVCTQDSQCWGGYRCQWFSPPAAGKPGVGRCSLDTDAGSGVESSFPESSEPKGDVSSAEPWVESATEQSVSLDHASPEERVVSDVPSPEPNPSPDNLSPEEPKLSDHSPAEPQIGPDDLPPEERTPPDNPPPQCTQNSQCGVGGTCCQNKCCITPSNVCCPDGSCTTAVLPCK